MNGVGIIGFVVLLVVIVVLFRKRLPFGLSGTTTSNSPSNYSDIDHKYNEERALKQKEIDRILDKINRRGINSLTKKEKELLDSFSRK